MVQVILYNDFKSVFHNFEIEHNDIALYYLSFYTQIPRDHTFIIIW